MLDSFCPFRLGEAGMKHPNDALQERRGQAKVTVRLLEMAEKEWFAKQLQQQHYLGAPAAVGDELRQVVERGGKPVALLLWGPAAKTLRPRDQWVGWTPLQRAQRLKLVVQNRRFLLLVKRGEDPNLASQALGAALRAVAGHYQELFGYRPVLAETFTDPGQFEGTCYKASNWEPVGATAGYRRDAADFYVHHGQPKQLWLYPLDARARAILIGPQLPMAQAPAQLETSSGVLPLSDSQMLSLWEHLRQVPDPRGPAVDYRIGVILTLTVMALMAGQRQITQIARFAQRLTQKQRRKLELPIKKGTKAFRQVPGYYVFYRTLSRIDPELLAKELSVWMQSQTSLPRALALDGKMIRDQIGLVSVVDHASGVPVAVAVHDSKEGTKRCEQVAARGSLDQIPSLKNAIVTADALHCQDATARQILAKDGDYLLQVKGNQPSLHAYAQTFENIHSPFLTAQLK